MYIQFINSTMRTKIQKWGNSLALRIPKSFAVDASIEAGSPIDLHFVEGKIVLVPVQQKVYKLDDLLSEVTEENKHDATDFGEPQGKEQW